MNFILKFGKFRYSQRAQHYLFLIYFFYKRHFRQLAKTVPHFPWASRLSLLLSPLIHYINCFSLKVDAGLQLQHRLFNLPSEERNSDTQQCKFKYDSYVFQHSQHNSWL